MSQWVLFLVALRSWFEAAAAQLPSIGREEALRGLSGVCVLVEHIPGLERARAGLTTDRVPTAVELRLRSYGITVLSRQECLADPRDPYLHVGNAAVPSILDASTTSF